MYDVVKTPLFGLLLTILLYQFGHYVSKRWKNAVINPFLVAVVTGLIFLKIFNISYDDYKNGGNIIHFFLTPITIILAVPLYKQFHIIKKNWFLFLTGIIITIVITYSLITISCYLFNVDELLRNSMYPKSVTAPMAIEISKSIGGDPNITILMVTFTGLTGGAISSLVCKLVKAKHPLSIGIGIGAVTHVIGTSKAIEIGELEGAISSASIGVTGVFSVFLIPLLMNLF